MPGMTPFRNEKNSNWEGAYRVPALVRFPGKIKAGSVSNEIVSTWTGSRPFWPPPASPDIKEKLLKGHKAGEKTFKVHLDGYNLLPLSDGQGEEEPAQGVPLLHRRRRPRLMRYDNWKMVFIEQRARGTLQIWAEPLHPLRVPKSLTCGPIPTNTRISLRTRTGIGSSIMHFCSPGADSGSRIPGDAPDFPPRQKAASFTVSDAAAKMNVGASGG